VTLQGNSAASGGGIHRTAGTINLKNTIISGSSPGNCVGTVTSLGYNLSSDNSCTPYFNQPGDWNNTIPYLGVLTDNGGSTLTHMPYPPSKAIDGGQCIGGKPTDQRGVTRPMGLACDIGAVEVAPGVSRLLLPMLVH
jgi:hypothetical protein